MPKLKKLPSHSIAQRVKRVQTEDETWLGWLLPTEVEYVCRRSGERNKRLDRKREQAKTLRKKGLAKKIPLLFKANKTFHKELLMCQQG